MPSSLSDTDADRRWLGPPIHSPQAELRRRTLQGNQYVIQDGAMTTAGGMGCGLLLMLVGLPLVIFPLMDMFSDTTGVNGVEQPMESPAAWSFWLMMSPQVFLGLALLGLALYMLYSAWQERGFRKATLTVPAHKFRRGEPFTAAFEYRNQRGRPLGKEGTIAARLVCIEVTQITQGTDPSYNYVKLWSHTFPEQYVSGSQSGFEAHWETVLPQDVPVSQYFPESWVVWQLQVLMHVGDKAFSRAAFMVEVE